MVSKVAVIALVAVIAVPILLGYALNLNEVTETDYRVTGDSVNVTPLLQNGEYYDYVQADTYGLNTNFTNDSDTIQKIIPIYKKTTSQKTSLNFSSNYGDWGGGGWNLNNYSKTYMAFDYPGTGNSYVTMQILNTSNNVVLTVQRATYIYYEKSTDSITYSYYGSGSTVVYDGHISGGNYSSINVTRTNMSTIPTWWGREESSPFVDLSAGFRLAYNTGGYIALPYQTKSFVMSVDLDSITDPTYQFFVDSKYGRIGFYKTTVDGVASWKAGWTSGTARPIYYDPTSNSNTYQILYEIDYSKNKVDENYRYYDLFVQLRYVGNWPSFIGIANSYFDYDYHQYNSSEPISSNPIGLKNVRVLKSEYAYGNNGGLTPTIRMDAALCRGTAYPVITDKSYDPATFKDNPSTTISNVNTYGASIEFGGNTYNVSKGNITIGTHQVSVNGLVLSSVPSNGGYDNKIGDTIISTTATPSAITFNGKWSASITTAAQEEYEYTRTEWVAGEFAWDGLDHNFLMVGLLTSLGAFIALGIYARRTKASIWPLLVVCGGAALTFFVML